MKAKVDHLNGIYFDLEASRKRIARSAFDRFINGSKYTSIYEVYKRPSEFKASAYNDCINIMNKFAVLEYGIVSRNVFMFTFGFTFVHPNYGNICFAYITPNYNTYIEIESRNIER